MDELTEPRLYVTDPNSTLGLKVNPDPKVRGIVHYEGHASLKQEIDKSKGWWAEIVLVSARRWSARIRNGQSGPAGIQISDTCSLSKATPGGASTELPLVAPLVPLAGPEAGSPTLVVIST